MKKSFLLLLMGAFLLVTTACSSSTIPEVVNDQEVISSDSTPIETPLLDTIDFVGQE
jgi:uncharacterized protein YcfL